MNILNGKLLKFVIAALLTIAVRGQAEPFKLPSYETYQLANGLKVYLMPQKEVPLLHMTFGVATGSANDGDQFGLASLTGDALVLGTKKLSKDKLEDLVDFHGAEIGSAANQDYSYLEMSIAAKDADKLLPVFGDLVMAPTFPEKELTKLRERIISELKKAKESPNQVADQFFNRLVFDKHPYGHPIVGTPTSISKLKSADLVKFHSAWYRPQHGAISIVGDMDVPAMKKLVEQTFGTWSAGTISAKPVAMSNASEKPTTGRVLLINKNDSHETTFRIGGLGVKRDDKNWSVLQVVNTILGGRFTSLLNEELRVKTGLTYGARSRFEGFKNSGTFAIASFTATENTSRALELAIKTYTNFVKAGVDEATLESAKAYVKGQFPPRYETSDALSGLLIQMWVYNLPDTIINNFESEVSGLTLAKANELIKTQFPANQLDIVLIGQAARIHEIAKQYGTVTKAEIAAAQEGRL